MPRISEFYGIAIYMYFEDHNPPHFHAVQGWVRQHRQELLDDWNLAREGRPLRRIAPLE